MALRLSSLKTGAFMPPFFQTSLRLMKFGTAAFALFILTSVQTMAAVTPPAPYGAVPSARQLEWQDLEFVGFLHFTVNTFTDKEWGYGDEGEKVFNPAAFDAGQIVGAARKAGMKELILTCKHHD